MKQLIFAFLCLSLTTSLLLSACVSDSDGAYRQVSQSEAVQLMNEQSGYIILDVRTPEEYDEGHIPGAVNIPNEDIGTVPPYRLPDKDQLILVYCRSGNRSKQASRKLADMGYTNVVEFGGINTWEGAVVSEHEDPDDDTD